MAADKQLAPYMTYFFRKYSIKLYIFLLILSVIFVFFGRTTFVSMVLDVQLQFDIWYILYQFPSLNRSLNFRQNNKTQDRVFTEFVLMLQFFSPCYKASNFCSSSAKS